MIEAAHSIEDNLVFHTKHTALHFDDSSECFEITFFGQNLNFRFCELYAFKSKIQQIDIVHLLASDTADIELVSLPHCNRLFALSILEILEIKELLSGAFVMFELNSIIHQRVVRKFI